MDFIIWGILIGAGGLLLWKIVNGSMKPRSSGIAHLTAFHDWQPKDKQNAIEIVIERKAGKEISSQSNERGEGDDQADGHSHNHIGNENKRQ